MGRDKRKDMSVRIAHVSIHAPAWGATDRLGNLISRGLFQFTRPHGARPNPELSKAIKDCFNSRARMGRDKPNLGDGTSYPVSIHAPAWGATSAKSEKGSITSFNSRARMGRDTR